MIKAPALETKASDDRRHVVPPSAIVRKSDGRALSGAAALRQRIGNDGVRRLMREISDTASGSVSMRSPSIQSKVAVSQPGEPYELEANRVADLVMQTPSDAQRMPSDEHRVANSLAPSLDGLVGGGSALPATARAFFEPRFGASFADVRVHTDARAAGVAESLSARAFTVGHDIVFGAGQYAPESSDGRHLLAHELTHVLQQDRARGATSAMAVSALMETDSVVQRWEGLEHKKVGNRAQIEFPYRGTILKDMTALRATPNKDPSTPHENTKADLLVGAKLLVLGKEHGWLQVLVESGMARDKKGATIPAATLTGYVSHELVGKSTDVFDATLPVGGGLELSYGDLVAFGGDHFKNFAQIGGEAADPAGRTRLKRLRDLTDSEATQSPAYEDATTISKEYAERYRDLALENVSHFSGGGTALTTWQEMHRDAVLAALEGGKKGDSSALGAAYSLNAFADHFLTDSFSAGHVRVPREQAILYYKKLAQDVFQNIIDYLSNRLGTRIYELLRRDYWRVRQFGDEGDRQNAIARVRAQIMQTIMDAGGPAKVQELFGVYVAGAFSKIMHDHENAEGLMVVSRKHPEGWTVFGDAKLEAPANAKNLAYMTEAVQASKQDLVGAFRIGLDLFSKYGKTPTQAAIDAAMAALSRKVGPPYSALAFVPTPGSGVKPLAAWEWGNLDRQTKEDLVAMVAKYLTTTAQQELLSHFPVRQEVEVAGPNVDARPRDAAADVLRELLADPVRFLEQAFGRTAGP
jgi:hypothetical protein